MKNLMKKTVSILLVATCMVGTAAFADTNENQEIIEMELCTAMDLLGGIPENVQGPDREDIEAILKEIDEYSAAGQLDKANALWETVYEILGQYEIEGSTTEESMTDEELIDSMIASLEERIQRYEAIGDFESAQELRAELERIFAELEGEFEPDMDQDHEEPMDNENQEGLNVDQIVAETEEEIIRLEEAGEFEAADALRAELEGFLNEFFGENHEDDHNFEEVHNFEDDMEMGPDVITLEDLMNKVGHEVSPEKMDMLQDLLNVMNALIQNEF